MKEMRKALPLKQIVIGALGFTFVIGVYAIISSHFRNVGLMAPDESYYTLAARTVWEGKMPYRDFAYMQMPLMPYINGAVMSIIGFGLDNHRFLSSVWAGIGIIALIVAMRQRFSRWEPGFVAAFAVAGSPRWGFLQSMGVWAGVAGMFLNLSLAAVLWPGPLRRRVVLFAIFGTLSIGCRLSGAPIVALLALILILEAPGWKKRLEMFGICIGIGSAANLPFVLAAPQRFYFMNWQYHMESTAERDLATKALQAWDVSPSAIVIIAIALFSIPLLVQKRKWAEILLLAAGLTGIIVPIAPASAWGVYIGASVPVAAMAGVTAIWASGMAVNNPHRHVMWAFPLMSLFHITPLEVLEGAATEVEEIGALISQEVEDGPILTPANIIAVESGRDVIRGTEMGHFSAMFPWDEKRAERFHMTTLNALIDAIEDQEPAAVILVSQPRGWMVWNFRWALPTMEIQPETYISNFQETIRQCYKLVWQTSTMNVYVPRRDW